MASQLLGIPNAITVYVKERVGHRADQLEALPDAAVTLERTLPLDKRGIVEVKKSNKDGIVWFSDLEDGNYRIHVEKEGYKALDTYRNDEGYKSLARFESILIVKWKEVVVIPGYTIEFGGRTFDFASLSDVLKFFEFAREDKYSEISGEE